MIVLESEGKKTPFYVDSFGFQKLENFFEERFVRTEAEKKIISDFREKTQKYFRPVDGRKAEEIENNVREYLHKKCESRVCRYNSVKCCCMEAEAGGRKSRLLIWMF